MASPRSDPTQIDPEALRRVMREHQILLETVRESPVHFCVYDPDDHLIAWNKPYEQNYPKVFRDLRAQANQRRLTYSDLLRHEMRDTLTADALEAEVEKRVEMQANADGEAVVREYGGNTLRVHKYRLPSGAVAGLAVDITDLAERERELRDARETAEASEASKARLLANISHEIRTPMNGIMGLAAMLADTKLTDEQRELVETITVSADALLTTINEVLDFSKIEAGKLEILAEPFDLATLCTSITRLLQPVADQKGIRITLEVSNACKGWFMGDALRIRQCLLNIAGNAIKFTREGGVTIQCDIAGSDALISISDSGVGIAADQIQSIFEAFEQGDGKKAREFEGTGLGLTITRQLIGLMSGEISVESTLGVGSTFRVRLPMASTTRPDDHASSSNATNVLEESCLQQADVLVADDNRTNRMVIDKMIGKAIGCLRFAKDGCEAVRMAHERRPDILFMDVAMPILDGIEATRQIRTDEAQKGNAPIPIYGLTAHAMETTLADGIAAGMNTVLTKPISKADLVNCIVDIVARKEA